MTEKRGFTRIEQPAGSKLCLACVVATLTDTTLQEVVLWCDHWHEGSPLPFSKVVQYLAVHRWHLGILFTGRFALIRSLLFIMVRRKFGAILIVQPARQKGTHAVLWTGREIIDPAPGAHGKRLRDYQILEWWPLVRVE